MIPSKLGLFLVISCTLGQVTACQKSKDDSSSSDSDTEEVPAAVPVSNGGGSGGSTTATGSISLKVSLGPDELAADFNLIGLGVKIGKLTLKKDGAAADDYTYLDGAATLDLLKGTGEFLVNSVPAGSYHLEHLSFESEPGFAFARSGTGCAVQTSPTPHDIAVQVTGEVVVSANTITKLVMRAAPEFTIRGDDCLQKPYLTRVVVGPASSFDADFAKVTEKDTPSTLNLDGTWSGGCTDQGGGSYQQMTYDILGTHIDVTFGMYSDASCTSPQLVIQGIASLALGNVFRNGIGSEFNQTFGLITVTPSDAGTVSNFNSDSVCNKTDWAIGDHVPCNGLPFMGGDPLPALGSVEYSAVDLRDGKFFLGEGDGTVDQDGHDAAHREMTWPEAGWTLVP